MGDGVTDDAAAFEAAILAAETRSSPVYVPASPTAVRAGRGPDARRRRTGRRRRGLDAQARGVERLRPAAHGQRPARSAGCACSGLASTACPSGPADVDLSAVSLDGITVAGGAEGAILHGVEVIGCHSGLVIEGGVAAIVGCRFAFNRTGIEIRTGAQGSIFVSQPQIHACTSGILAEGAAGFEQLALRGGTLSACGRALELDGTASGWRGIELSDLTFADNLDADVEAGPRQSVGLRGCHLDESGKRSGTAVDLQAGGETVEAPNLVVENVRAEVTEVAIVQLSGGTNLNLLQAGDLIVLASDADDVDDHWTASRRRAAAWSTRSSAQTTTTAEFELARATIVPLVQAGDVIRVVGRFGTATVDSVGAGAPAGEFIWLRADDHCRVFAAHNPMPVDQIELGRRQTAELRYLPGLGGEIAEISGVELDQGAVNGALIRAVHVHDRAERGGQFHAALDRSAWSRCSRTSLALGDPVTAIFTYRADGLGLHRAARNRRRRPRAMSRWPSSRR